MTALVRPPAPDCWLHPALQPGPSSIAGWGLFARTPIEAATVVSILGGRLITGPELGTIIATADHYIDTVQITDALHLVLPPGTDNGLGNHACDPNLWWAGPYELAARRDIEVGEELTNDYATSTAADDFVMPCACGRPRCRQVITGHDWRLIELQQRYGDHWTPALLGLISR